MNKFEAGQTYTTRDGENFKVHRRTAKRITISSQFTNVVTVGIIIDDQRGEFAFPHGKYSQAPIIRA